MIFAGGARSLSDPPPIFIRPIGAGIEDGTPDDMRTGSVDDTSRADRVQQCGSGHRDVVGLSTSTESPTNSLCIWAYHISAPPPCFRIPPRRPETLRQALSPGRVRMHRFHEDQCPSGAKPNGAEGGNRWRS